MCWVYELPDNSADCPCCARLNNDYVHTEAASLYTGSLTSLSELSRMSMVYAVSNQSRINQAIQVRSTKRRRITPDWETLEFEYALSRTKQTIERNVNVPLGVRRLMNFLGVFDIFMTYPEANIYFDKNDYIYRVLAACCMPAISGHSEYKAEQTQLYRMLSSHDLSTVKQCVVEGSRQGGKTLVLSRFWAIMALMSPIGGQLINQHHINHEKASEILEVSANILRWARDSPDVMEKLKCFGVNEITFVREREQRFAILSQAAGLTRRTVNSVHARSSNGRGNAPTAVTAIDESAFVPTELHTKITKPLNAKEYRTMIHTTTPGEVGSDYHSYTQRIRQKNEEGDFSTLLISMSTACAECIGKKQGWRCCHDTKNTVPWKTLQKLESERREHGDDMTEYETEYMGINPKGSGGFFDKEQLERVFSPNHTVVVNLPTRPYLFISNDPGSHEGSFAAFKAAVITSSGQHCVIGMANFLLSGCGIDTYKAYVTTFVTAVFKHPIFSRTRANHITVIAMVEGNNNGVITRGAVSEIERLARRAKYGFMNPFLEKNDIIKEITNAGMYTRDSHKVRGIEILQGYLMLDTAFFVHPKCIAIDKITGSRPTLGEMCKIMVEQLARFHINPKNNRITGVVSKNDHDDLGCICLLELYWIDKIKILLYKRKITV